jgi:hypothetical protein
VDLIDPTGLVAQSCIPDFGECLKICLANYPGLDLAFAGLALGTGANLKLPWEIRSGASIFTSLDRRLPAWMRPNVNSGATVIRGTAGRVKYVGRYGTIAAGIAGFSAGYVLGASGVCLAECISR